MYKKRFRKQQSPKKRLSRLLTHRAKSPKNRFWSAISVTNHATVLGWNLLSLQARTLSPCAWQRALYRQRRCVLSLRLYVPHSVCMYVLMCGMYASLYTFHWANVYFMCMEHATRACVQQRHLFSIQHST
jgi:hypothetical protein